MNLRFVECNMSDLIELQKIGEHDFFMVNEKQNDHVLAFKIENLLEPS